MGRRSRDEEDMADELQLIIRVRILEVINATKDPVPDLAVRLRRIIPARPAVILPPRSEKGKPVRRTVAPPSTPTYETLDGGCIVALGLSFACSF